MKNIFLVIIGFILLFTAAVPAFAQNDMQDVNMQNMMNQNYGDQSYNQQYSQYDQNYNRQSYRPYIRYNQASGYIDYKAYSNTQRHLYFNVRQNYRYYGSADSNYYNYSMPSRYYQGALRYWDDDGNWYTVSIRNVKFSGRDVYMAGPVISGNVGNGSWLFAKARDGYGYGNDLIWGSFTDRDTALQGVTNLINPPDGPFQATSGYINVR